ncbi:MAG: OmpH family outer membrane protein [Bernardetiaceae bacterium]|jgi:outer membrane protein|nr:OmpH family outer membrane protein [Bernardetiaceae bacterium]
MKKQLIGVLAVALTLVSTVTWAQAKVGYTNADLILSALPEAKTIEAELKTYSSQIQAEMDKKQQEAQKKYQEYMQAVQGGNLAPSIRDAKEKEIQALQQGLQEFQEKAQQDVQAKQQALLSPVYDKIQDAIDEVAKAENFDFIITSNAGAVPILLYAKDEYDITNKVIVKLGGKPIDKTAPPAANQGGTGGNNQAGGNKPATNPAGQGNKPKTGGN